MDNDEQKSSIEVAKEKGKEAFNKALQSETAQKGKEAFNKAMQSKTAQKGKEVFNKAMQSETAQKGKEVFNKAMQSETAQKGKEVFNKAMQSENAQKGKEVFNKAMQSENAQKGKKLFNEGKAKFFALPKKIQYIVFGGCAVVFLIFMSRVFSKDSVPTQCSANICPPEIVLSLDEVLFKDFKKYSAKTEGTKEAIDTLPIKTIQKHLKDSDFVEWKKTWAENWGPKGAKNSEYADADAEFIFRQSNTSPRRGNIVQEGYPEAYERLKKAVAKGKIAKITDMERLEGEMCSEVKACIFTYNLPTRLDFLLEQGHVINSYLNDIQDISNTIQYVPKGSKILESVPTRREISLAKYRKMETFELMNEINRAFSNELSQIESGNKDIYSISCMILEVLRKHKYTPMVTKEVFEKIPKERQKHLRKYLKVVEDATPEQKRYCAPL